MLFLGVKPKVSHKWFRKTICSVDIIYGINFDINVLCSYTVSAIRPFSF